MATTVRPMTVADFADVYELGLRCYRPTDTPYNYWSITEVADHLETYPAFCFVADADGEIVGFALGADSFEIIEDTAHFEWIAVAPEHRRRGIATTLMETLLDVAQRQGKRRVVADIPSDNPHSQGLARKLGFTEDLTVTYFSKQLRQS